MNELSFWTSNENFKTRIQKKITFFQSYFYFLLKCEKIIKFIGRILDANNINIKKNKTSNNLILKTF